MSGRSDPLARADDDERDLQGIATWEPRSLLDRFLARYMGLVLRAAVVAVAGVLFAGLLVLYAVRIATDPSNLLVLVFFPFSVVPAAVLAGYVWYTDITSEPAVPLVGTYLLGIVLAMFPLVVNTAVGVLLESAVPGGVLRFLADTANHFLVVAPGEEAVKLGAVYAYAYWRADFDSVVDGAVYGAVAGLGFATIENVSYILGTLSGAEGLIELLVGGGVTTFFRSIAGPGHVIWSALAGYYLGLAKFNPRYAAPLVVKGWLIAVVLHGTYNSTLGALSGVFGFAGLGLLAVPAVVGFILVYHTAAFAYLFARLRRYRRAYAAIESGGEGVPAEGEAG